jgi:hypothetical protein
VHSQPNILNPILMKTNRRLLPLSLVLLAVLAGCNGKPENPNPVNPLLGDWTSTTPFSANGAAGCPTHYRFTETAQILTMAGRDISIPVTYNLRPNQVTVVMQVRSIDFKFLTPDTVAWTAGPCTYKRD